MSLLTIALFVLGYVVVLVVALALLRTAKHADEAADREYDAAVRSLTRDPSFRVIGEHDPDREIVLRRRTG
jgi:hypothetical protein